ncbi:MAG: acetolactate synthase [Burkholderiales bacterium]|nr:acetolactate synthase [Phycisphaerae bacterium]
MEQVLPPSTASGAGFEATRVRQFTVFLENRVGRLMALLRALEETDQRIYGLSIEESADAALVRVIVSDPDAAKPFLKQKGFSLSVTEVLCLELPREAKHPLQAICSCLLSGELNLHYTYPMHQGPTGPAIVVYVDDPTLAARILINRGFRILSEGDLRVNSPDGPDDFEPPDETE